MNAIGLSCGLPEPCTVRVGWLCRYPRAPDPMWWRIGLCELAKFVNTPPRPMRPGAWFTSDFP